MPNSAIPLGHWGLVICWSLGLGHWGLREVGHRDLVIGSCQEIAFFSAIPATKFSNCTFTTPCLSASASTGSSSIGRGLTHPGSLEPSSAKPLLWQGQRKLRPSAATSTKQPAWGHTTLNATTRGPPPAAAAPSRFTYTAPS